MTVSLSLSYGREIDPELATDVATAGFVSDFHSWFSSAAVARWLDIALYKAMQRIRRAVRLDDLAPVDELVKHSSSAVDIRTVLLQIKTFWKQLGWPDPEASYAYISKILDVSHYFSGFLTIVLSMDKIINDRALT